MCSCENVHRKFGTLKQKSGYRNAPVSHRFACIRVAKGLKTRPNIILGLMEAIGCVRAKTSVGSPVPRTSGFGYRDKPVYHRFACIRVGKVSKMLPNIILGLLKAIGCVHAKTFIETSVYPETVHSGNETHQFVIILDAIGE